MLASPSCTTWAGGGASAEAFCFGPLPQLVRSSDAAARSATSDVMVPARFINSLRIISALQWTTAAVNRAQRPGKNCIFRGLCASGTGVGVAVVWMVGGCGRVGCGTRTRQASPRLFGCLVGWRTFRGGESGGEPPLSKISRLARYAANGYVGLGRGGKLRQRRASGDRRYEGEVKDARLKSNSRRPLQIQMQL